MSKLNNLRKWLSLDESAKYLERKINEQVAITDILRFALDGHLILSVNLQSPKIAKKVEIKRVKMAETATNVEVYVRGNWGVYIGESFSPDREIDFAIPTSNEITSLSGVQDTPLLGIERLFAEEQYCKSLGLPKPSRKQDIIRGVTISAGPSGFTNSSILSTLRMRSRSFTEPQKPPGMPIIPLSIALSKYSKISARLPCGIPMPT
ncbi:hypothetical protein [Pectobacterium carotovorum]|uniref:hypothetical protein n=1 Tax=Pectobacterium carotovorum TaxID=554 RepID=UPI002B05BC65|nr:hypothetical protein [Pectobacterium carotovorum]